MRLRTIVIGIVVLLLAGAGVWWAFSPRPVAVDLAVVGRGPLVVTVDDEGVTRIRETYTISTPVAGEVLRIPLKVGDKVEAGQVLATVVPPRSTFLDERSLAEAQAAVKAAEAAVESAKTDVDAAKADQAYWQSEYNRNRQLLEKGFASKKAVDQARLELDRRNLAVTNAQAVLELRQRELEQARARLLGPNGTDASAQRFDVHAPVSGEVLEVDNTGTRTLQAGVPLMKIGDPSDLEIVADLLSSDAVRIRTGAPAKIERWGGDAVLDAQVARIEPVGFTKVSALGVEEQRVRVHLDILSDRKLWSALGQDYRVFARIQAQKVDDALLVPTAALFRDGQQWAVFAVEDGHAVLKDVTLGLRNAESAQVTDGLEAGASVIVHPSDQIADGALVSRRNSTK